jgi:hypothetical protein
MSEMNETIAQFKGWIISATEYCGHEIIGQSWKHLVDGMWVYEQPNFDHDANLYMALFEEMAKSELLLTLRHYRPTDLWIIEFYNENATKVEWRVDAEKSIGTAICKAYVKLHGLEFEE